MEDFCLRCGRKLKGDEERCPECGAPTGFRGNHSSGPDFAAPPYGIPPQQRKGPSVGTIIALGLAVVCLLGIIVLPNLINPPQSESYTMTVTAKDISIKDMTGTYGTSMTAFIILDTQGKTDGESRLGNWDGCNAQTGAVLTLTEKNTKSFKFTSDPKDKNIGVFLCIVTKTSASGAIEQYDYVDIYTATYGPGAMPPDYPGCTGVSFKPTETNASGDIELKGDCDPVGIVNLNVTITKN